MYGRGGGGGRRGGAGGGRRGGRRAGYEGFTREPQPPPTGGGGRDQEGRQRDRGGSAPPPPAPLTRAESILSRDAERLSLSETKPVVVTPESSSAIVPAPVDATPRSDKSIRLPARPGFGIAGNKCVVKANHFSVKINDIDIDLCCYNVAIVEETKSSSTNRSIIAQLVKVHKQSDLGDRICAYDGHKKLYTAGQLPFTSKKFVIKLSKKELMTNVRDKEYVVTIEFARKLDLHHLLDVGPNGQLESRQESIEAINTVFRASPSTKYEVVGTNFLSTEFSFDLGGGVDCLRGFNQSLRPTQIGLSLIFDVAAKTFYKGPTVVDFMIQYLNIRDTSKALSDHDILKLAKILKGVRVEGTHNTYLRYKICGISSDPIEKITFPNENGTSISVVQYFRDRYGWEIKYIKLPCLLVGSHSSPKYLPMEVCVISGQKYVEKLSDKQTINMSKITCQKPAQREACILEMFSGNRYSNDKTVNGFGLKIHNEMVSVDARVLPPPTLKYNDNGEQKSCKPSVGVWDMKKMKMFHGGIVNNWACFNFSKTPKGAVNKFCDEIVAMCIGNGMLVASMAWPDVTKYQCVVSAQRPREEIIEDLFTPQKGKTAAGGMFRELMLDFNKSTNIQPDRIIFYRDGVGEGEFSHVLSRELGAIKKACATLHPNYSPKITVVAVQKRHRTRLFAEKHGIDAWTNKNRNILPGTVVDRQICHPTEFDFYLCSHASTNGTTRPTHYHILYDENNISADGLQTLTNNLCYTYARCTRSVSIVPAVYYAHLAAFRARLYIEVDRYQTSTSLGDGSRESPVAIRKLPEIQKELKGVMFYI